MMMSSRQRLALIQSNHLSSSVRRMFAKVLEQSRDSLNDTYSATGFTNVYFRQHGYPSRRRSLVDDARFETVKNREARMSWILEQRQSSSDLTLSEEELLLANEVDEAEVNADPEAQAPPTQTQLLLTLKDGGFGSLPKVLNHFRNFDAEIEHIESRKATVQGHHELFVNLDISKENVLALIKALRQEQLADCSVIKENSITIKDPLVSETRDRP
ncbi:Tyrosine 3-monooxygenase [Halotydeus destructor]|nr:Tyrosine 3-monooxygenase [Halotydeus destructor]